MRSKLHSTNCSLYSFTDTCFYYARLFHLRHPLGPWTRSIFVFRLCPRHCIPPEHLEFHWSFCYRRMVRSRSGLDSPSPLRLNSLSGNATADDEVCVTSFQWRARRWQPGWEWPLVVSLSYATYTTCTQSRKPR